MEVNEITVRAKNVEKYENVNGYIIYIFEDLEYKDSDFKYITCIRFPNWDNPMFNIGDIGYLNIRYVQAGLDKWWDGKDFNPYNYTNIQFLKFVLVKERMTSDLILD